MAGCVTIAVRSNATVRWVTAFAGSGPTTAGATCSRAAASPNSASRRSVTLSAVWFIVSATSVESAAVGGLAQPKHNPTPSAVRSRASSLSRLHENRTGPSPALRTGMRTESPPAAAAAEPGAGVRLSTTSVPSPSTMTCSGTGCSNRSSENCAGTCKLTGAGNACAGASAAVAAIAAGFAGAGADSTTCVEAPYRTSTSLLPADPDGTGWPGWSSHGATPRPAGTAGDGPWLRIVPGMVEAATGWA